LSKITDEVAALAAPIAEKHGCELWSVEYVKEAGTWFLRVFIDREQNAVTNVADVADGEVEGVTGGISIELCEAVSRELDPILDEHEDLIPGSYTFEVSSAGAERQLKRPSDFARFIGHLTEVKLYVPRKDTGGRREYIGKLLGYDNGAVELEVDGTAYRFEKTEVANVRLRVEI
jgi:ribosome maturation factor RimP